MPTPRCCACLELLERRQLLAAVPIVQADLSGVGSQRLSNSAATSIAALAMSPTAPPVILKVSDAVKGGRMININGGGIDAATVDVAIALDTTGQPPATPPAGAIHPQILQTDASSQFVVCKMPAGATPGVYDVWVKNGLGWSSPALMNAARALYTSDYQAYAGVSIEVVGRNFDQNEFGGPTGTQIRLNNGSGGIYVQTIASLNPYNVTFTVGASVPLGSYFIEVTNDNGVHWSRPSSGQTLTIVTHTGIDPLGLGVSWAQDFKWSSVFNVTSYGATGNDTTDDTAAVQNAVYAAQSAGGGVVYFPNGNYYVSNIFIGAGIVLEGQDEYATKIYYNGTGGNAFIQSMGSSSQGGIGQLQGVARMSILLKDSSIRPDVFVQLGEWGGTLDSRTANRIFVAGVNLNYDYTSGFASSQIVTNDTASGTGGITYTGTWTYASSGHTGDYQNDIHYTTTGGDSFQYTFTGTTIYYSTETGSTAGNVDIYLDGALKATVNCYSATVKTNQMVYMATSTTWGSHTLKVVNHDNGKMMALDVLTSLTPRAVGLLITAKERVLVQNNNFVGWCATSPMNYVKQYFTIKNNSFTFSLGLLHTTASYSFIENNTVSIHPEYRQDTHGIFTRADAYAANNSVSGAGDASNVMNDGEGICNEGPNGEFDYGAVVSGTATSLTVSPKLALVNPVNLEYGDLSVLITDGTGLGQLRKVAVNPAANTLTIASDQPFAIIPDSTSRWTLFLPLTGFTVYKNIVSNCAHGIVPFGNEYDTVVADNTTTDTDGVFVWAARMSDGGTYANDSADAYIRITRNTITGVSRRTNQGGIGVYTGRFDGAKFYDVMAWSTEITDNSITGNNKLTPTSGWPPYAGIYISSYYYSNMSDGSGTGDATNTIISGNRLSNLKTGVVLTKCDYGQVISSNGYDSSVLQFLVDSASPYGKSDNTLVTSDNGLLPAAPSTTSLKVNDGSVQRSMVTSLTVSFDQPVMLAYDAITLALRGQPIASSVLITPSSDFKTFTLTFSGTGIIGGSLADGSYTLTIKAASVRDTYNQTLTGGNRVYRFFRLFGDVNGDRSVTTADLVVFKGVLNKPAKYLWYLDFNSSGAIDNADYLQLRTRLIKRLL